MQGRSLSGEGRSTGDNGNNQIENEQYVTQREAVDTEDYKEGTAGAVCPKWP